MMNELLAAFAVLRRRRRHTEWTLSKFITLIVACVAGVAVQALLAKIAPNMSRKTRSSIGTLVIFAVILIGVFFFKA